MRRVIEFGFKWVDTNIVNKDNNGKIIQLKLQDKKY